MIKILWVVNSPLGPIGEKVYGKRSNGLWMDALLESFRGRYDYRLVVVTTADIDKTLRVEEDKIIYYALCGGPPMLYNENSLKNIRTWSELLDQEKPDVIQVWGTEFTHGLCALRCAKNIPSIIYVQGYLGSIARYYFAGLSHRELIQNTTLRDVLKRDSMIKQQKKYALSTSKEKEMFRLSGRMITENEWCEKSIRAIVPQIRDYKCPLSINSVFEKTRWEMDLAERHAIVCNASGYPLKGLHMVLRAVSILKKKYPDVKLYVPGPKMISDGSFQGLLRKRGYTKYIESLIKRLNISDSIVWLGNLTQYELAQIYKKARVFVLSSSIENHSSSLKEAMMVGTPCVASSIGGIPEYVTHGKSAMMYRFEEYEIMAADIMQIFENDKLALRLSQTGREQMIALHKEGCILEKMCNIYDDILKEEKTKKVQ